VTSPADYGAIAEEMARSGNSLFQGNEKWRLAQKGVLPRLRLTIRPIASDAGAGGRRLRAAHSGGLSANSAAVVSEKDGPALRRKSASEGGPCTPTLRARAWRTRIRCRAKELSYNNIVDLQAAWDSGARVDEPVCAIIKHTNPCGTATGKTLAEAYVRALECDPVSAFGGVIGVKPHRRCGCGQRDGQVVSGSDRRAGVR